MLSAMPPDVRIRFATALDAETILRLVRDLAEYEREPDAVELTVPVLRAQLESEAPPFQCLLAERDGVALGFALFFSSYSTWRGRPGIYLEDLFVTPAARGLGIGKALLRRLAVLAVERGCARVEWSVLDWNTPAIEFYRSLGATPMDTWTVYRLTGTALDALGNTNATSDVVAR
jgi:GNAT superfamily N-acetyltransferase